MLEGYVRVLLVELAFFVWFDLCGMLCEALHLVIFDFINTVLMFFATFVLLRTLWLMVRSWESNGE